MSNSGGIISSEVPAEVVGLLQARSGAEDLILQARSELEETDRMIKWMLGHTFNSVLAAASFGFLSARVCGFSMEGSDAVRIQVERVPSVEGIRERLLRVLGSVCQCEVTSETMMDIVVPFDQFQSVASRAESAGSLFYEEQRRQEDLGM